MGTTGLSLRGSNSRQQRRQAAAATAAGWDLHAAAALQLIHRNARSRNRSCTRQNEHMARMPHLPLREMPP